MKKVNIKKVRPFLVLILIYLVYILFISVVVKICSFGNDMNPLNNVESIIGYTVILAESLYLGFSFSNFGFHIDDENKRVARGWYVVDIFIYLAIGAIVLFVSEKLMYLLYLAETYVFHIPIQLKLHSSNYEFFSQFILTQFILFVLYRYIKKSGNTNSENASNNCNERDK